MFPLTLQQKRRREKNVFEITHSKYQRIKKTFNLILVPDNDGTFFPALYSSALFE